MKHTMKTTVAIAALTLAGFAGWAAFAQQVEAPQIALVSDTQTLTKGEEVYLANCASCHGADLEGAANWRQRNADGTLPAPPHDATGHTWHHDAATLFALTKYGVAAYIGDPGYASNMPAYEDTLTDAEIVAVLSYIRSTWPADIREAYDAREEAVN